MTSSKTTPDPRTAPNVRHIGIGTAQGNREEARRAQGKAHWVVLSGIFFY